MRRVIYSLLSVILIASLLIVGCAQPTSKPAPAPTPPPPKKLVVAIKQTGENFEIMTVAQQLPNITNIAINVYDYYLAREPNATGMGKIIPGLCESWTISPDGKMIQFTLRKGVKFHSGDPLTTADAKFSFDRMMNTPFYKSTFPSVDKLEVVDDYTFKVYFKSPDVVFMANLGFPIASKKYFDKVGEAEFVKRPVGTGPYKFADFKTGEYVDLEAFSDYWGKAPTIKQVRFRFVPEDTTRTAMLKTGEADIVTQIPYPLIPDIEKTKGLKTVRDSSGTRTEFIKFQNVNPKTPWYDIRVRQAIALAINREAIVKDVMSGLVNTYASLRPGEVGYDPQLKFHEYNPDKAKTLLAEAGYPNGLELTYNYMLGEVTGSKETAEAVALYLNKVGIKANLVSWEAPKWAEYNSKASGKPDLDYVSMGIGSFAGQPDVTKTLNNQYSKSGMYASYFNDQVSDLIVQARSTMDDNARTELVQKIFRLLYADFAYIPIWTAVKVYGMKDTIDYTPTCITFGYESMLIKDITMK